MSWVTQRETIDNRLNRIVGQSTGFDYLRIGLSIAVLSWHSITVSYGEKAEVVALQGHGPLVATIRAILPAFFALSGFLVAGSLVRTKSIHVFFLHRLIRLVPALAVEILLSALVIGPIVTSGSLRDYFAGHEFRLYFLNILGDIHYVLPGVFEQNPDPLIVNRSLWTIPYELACYISLLLIALFHLIPRRVLLTVLIVGFWLLYWIATDRLGWVGGAPAARWVEHPEIPGRTLLFSFLAGVLLNAWHDRVILNGGLFLVAIAVSYVSLIQPEISLLSAASVAYVTVYLGMTSPRKIPVLMSGDYSYGLYLFAFPIQQVVSFYLPETRIWWVNILVSLPASLAYAYFSWNVIEKPTLSQRKTIISWFERGFTWLQLPIFARAKK